MNTKPSIDCLTGLRFVAALIVFIHHLGGKFGFAINRYSIGSLAVTFFFVLSGFVLTYVYHDRLQNWVQIKEFAKNRIARIWPLHIVCTMLSIFLMGHFNHWPAKEGFAKLLCNLFLLHSWVPLDDWVFSFNGVSWSISTEIFFYFVFPLLMFSGGKYFRSRVLLCIGLVACFILFINHMNQSSWFERISYYRIGHVNPLVRLPEFCLGIVAGLWFLNKNPHANTSGKFWLDSIAEISIVATIVFLCYWVSDRGLQGWVSRQTWGSQFLGSWTRVAYPSVLFAVAVFVFANSRGLLSRIFANKLMVYLGEISFAFYMIHFLVLRHIHLSSSSYGLLSGWQIAAHAFAISIGSSILLYEFVEKPLKAVLLGRWKFDFSSWNLFPLARVALFGLVGVGLIALPTFVLEKHAQTVIVFSEEVQRIVDRSDPAIRNVNFGSQIRLLGCEFRARKEKLELHLAWFKRVEFDHRRIVIVLDQNHEQIARGIHNQKSIRRSEVGTAFVDRVFIDRQNLKVGSAIAVFFRKKSGGFLIPDRGEKSKNKRLILAGPDKIETLKHRFESK